MAITNASRLADFGSGIGTEGAIIQVDNTNARLGIGTTNPQAMLQVGTGVSVYGNSVVTSPYESLGDSNNRYVSYLYKRPQTGTLFPHDNHGNRVSSTNGVKYPREIGRAHV